MLEGTPQPFAGCHPTEDPATAKASDAINNGVGDSRRTEKFPTADAAVRARLPVVVEVKAVVSRSVAREVTRRPVVGVPAGASPGARVSEGIAKVARGTYQKDGIDNEEGKTQLCEGTAKNEDQNMGGEKRRRETRTPPGREAALGDPGGGSAPSVPVARSVALAGLPAVRLAWNSKIFSFKLWIANLAPFTEVFEQASVAVVWAGGSCRVRGVSIVSGSIAFPSSTGVRAARGRRVGRVGHGRRVTGAVRRVVGRLPPAWDVDGGVVPRVARSVCVVCQHRTYRSVKMGTHAHQVAKSRRGSHSAGPVQSSEGTLRTVEVS